MKNIRIFIKAKNLEQLRALADEVYLYEYIVNNDSELDEDNVFRNPTFYRKIGDTVYMYIEDVSVDDIDVWNETYKDLNSRRISYYAVITDTSNGCYLVYNNLKDDIPFIQIDKDTKIIDAIKKIEDFNKNIVNEFQEEMEY